MLKSTGIRGIEDSRHIVYLDILRILATIGIVYIHLAVDYMYVTVSADLVNVVFNGCFHWAVPIFTMISGTIFLRQDKSFKEMCVYAWRVFRCYWFWSVIYIGINSQIEGWEVDYIIRNCIIGYWQLWYLRMLFGLYLLTPILRRLVKNKIYFKYALLCSGVLSFLVVWFLGFKFYITDYILRSTTSFIFYYLKRTRFL